jgi:hypothetical protein
MSSRNPERKVETFLDTSGNIAAFFVDVGSCHHPVHALPHRTGTANLRRKRYSWAEPYG